MFSNSMDEISRVEECAWHMWYHCRGTWLAIASIFGILKIDHGPITTTTTNVSYFSSKMSKIVVAMYGGMYEHYTQYQVYMQTT